MPDNNKPTIQLDESAIIKDLNLAGNLQTGSKGYFGESSFGKSQYDLPNQTSWVDMNPQSLEQLRGERQGLGSELSNAIGGGLAKLPFTVIGNVGSMLDIEDYYNQDHEVGNWLTAWAEEQKGNIEDATKIYKSNENTLNSREWWMNNAKGLIDSAGAFAVTGLGLGGGVNVLSKLLNSSKVVPALGTVVNAGLLNQAESIPIAMNVYKTAYDTQFKKLSEQFPEMSQEELDFKSREIASDAAAYSININRINIPLNLTSVGAFLRPIPMTREVAKNFSKKDILANMLKEGSQEYLEENVNMIAEKEALRKADQGNSYVYDFDRTVNDVLSKEGFETGLVGFIGGLVQTGLTDLSKTLKKDSPSYDEDGNIRVDDNGNPLLVSQITSQKERYNAQQKSKAAIELLSKSEGVATIKETLDNVRKTSQILNDIQIASVNNDVTKVEELKNDLLTNQSLDAFKNGTTDNLIQMYKSISNDPTSKEKFGEDVHKTSQEAIKQIEDLEKVFQKHQTLPQRDEIFNNRSKQYFNLKQAESIKREINNARLDQAREIEITNANTPEQVEALVSTQELKVALDKMFSLSDKANLLNDEYKVLTSPEYTFKKTEEQQVQEPIQEPTPFEQPTESQTTGYHPNPEINDLISKANSKEDLDNLADQIVTPDMSEETLMELENSFIKRLEDIDKGITEIQETNVQDKINYIANKIVNRGEGEQFSPEEQQFYENYKNQVEDKIKSLQISNLPIEVENQETLSHGVTTSVDTSKDDDLDRIESVSNKKYVSKRPNALMLKFYEFKEGTKQWIRDITGKVVPDKTGEQFAKDNKTPIVTQEINNPKVANTGTEVTYHHNNQDIWLVDNEGRTVGYLGLPHELTKDATKEQIASREKLIKNRKHILSQPSNSIKTTIIGKGFGKLLTKIDSKNQMVLDEQVSSRPEDMIDERPLFLYDNGISLVSKNLNDEQQIVANTFEGVTFSKEDPTDKTKPRIGVGRVYQAVKNANGSWSVIPVYTNLLKNQSDFAKISDLVITTLQNSIKGEEIDFDQVRKALHPYVFVVSSKYKKNPNALRISDGKVTVGGETITFKELSDNVNLDKLIKGLGSIRANIAIESLNTPLETKRMLDNNVLVTNAYTDESGNYFVQPYLEVDQLELEDNKPVENLVNTSSNNEQAFTSEAKETPKELNKPKFDVDNHVVSDDDMLYSRTQLGSTEITSKDIKALQKILPGLTLANAKQLQEVKGNLKDTYGMFHNMLIYLFNGATKGTLFHEAFHGVFRNILSETERIAILNDAVVKYDAPTKERLEFLRQAPGNNKLNTQALIQLHYEERLADDFAKFADGQINPSLTQRVKNLFKKIFDVFNIFRNKPTSVVEQTFENIKQGKYAGRSIAAKLLNKGIDLNQFGYAYSRVFTDGKTPLTAELDRINSIANVLLSKISNEMSKGIDLSKIDINKLANEIRDEYVNLWKTEDAKPESEKNKDKLTIAYRVAENFGPLLDIAKRQISLTKKIKLKGDFVIIDESEGVEDNSDREDANTLESDKGKGYGEMTAVSGIKSATHEIKLFLSNIPVVEDSVIQKDPYGFTLFHPFEKIYYKLEQSLVGTTSYNEQLKVMNKLAPYSPEIKQVLEAIDNIKDSQKLKNFKQQFAANFNKQVLNYKLVTYVKQGDKFVFKMFEPNRKDVAINLNNTWTITNISDPSNKETDDIRVFNDKLGAYEVSSQKVSDLLDRYRTKENNKIVWVNSFEPTIETVYTLAHKLGVGLSYDTIVKYTEVNKDNMNSLAKDLVNYAENMYVNPMFTVSRQLLNKLIQLEIDVQTELFTSSFNNVENSVVYAIQHQSFASKLIKSLTNNTSASATLNADLQRDPMNYNNFMLSKESILGLEMFALDGLKMQGDGIEGKKFNQIHSDDYLAMVINMFNNDLDKLKKNTEAKAIYAPIIPAEKGLSFAFAGPKILVGLESDGKLKQNSVIQKEFEQLLYNELARIRQTLIDIETLPKEKLIANYHQGKKLGLEFNTIDISPNLKKKLISKVESTLTQKLTVHPSEFVKSLVSDMQDDISKEVYTLLNKLIDKHIELVKSKNVISEKDGKLITNKFETSSISSVRDVIANWALNSYLWNVSSSNLINGDPAFYKGAEDNGKRFYQGYSMLKYADTSILDDSFKYLKGGKMKINVVDDVEAPSRFVNNLLEIAEKNNLPEVAKLAKEEYDTTYDEKGNKKEPINAADAQLFVSVGLYEEIKKLFGNDSQELRDAYTSSDIAEQLNKVDPNGKGILSIEKPFIYGVQWNNDLKRYTPIQVKCSIFPISNKFVANNPVLAKHKAMMDADPNYPQAIAFKSSMKALLPFKADLSNPEQTSIVEIDMNNYGEQVANPDHQLDSENSSLRQTKMLFYGMVENDKKYGNRTGRELKDEIAKLDKANIEESLREVMRAFKGNHKDLMKFIQEAVSSRNATSILEDVFTMDENGKFQYNLDLINSKSTIQLISSIFSDRVVRQKFIGGSAPQASAIGLHIPPKESDYKNAAEFQKAVDQSKELTELQSSLEWIKQDPNDPKSIDYIQAYAPAHVKEFINSDGSIKDNIPDELKKMLVYRIPTEGAHSMMAVKIVGFLPAEYKGAMLLPLEVTKQFGADFDFDKINFIAKDFYTTKQGFKSYEYLSESGQFNTEKRYEILINYVLRNNPDAKKLIYEANEEAKEFDYKLDKGTKLQVLIDNGLVPHIDDFSQLSIEEQNIKPARNNRLLDNYMQIIRSVEMLESLITPSGPGAIEKVYKKVQEPISVGNFFEAAYQLFNKDLFHKISMLKGIAALQVSGHAWATEGILKIKPKINKMGEIIPQGIKIYKGNVYNELGRVMSDGNKKIVEELSSMMAVILDAVKTPDQLPSIGISLKTLPMWSYIVRLGLGSEVASKFTSQPAIKELSLLLEANDIQLKDKSFNKKDIRTVINKYKKEYSDLWNDLVLQVSEGSKTYEELQKAAPEKVVNYKSLDLDALDKFTKKSKELSELKSYEKLEQLKLQLVVLNIFEDSQAVIQELGQLNQLFNINKETGPNFEDVNTKLELFKSLTKQDTLISGIDNLLHSDAIFPYIQTVQGQMEIMEDNYNFALPFFNAVKNHIAQSQIVAYNSNFTNIKAENREIANGFIQMFLDAETTFKDLYTEDRKLTREEFSVDIKKILSKKIDTSYKYKIFDNQPLSERNQKFLKGMTIFKSLEVNNIKNSEINHASLKGGRYELKQKELIINDIIRLYNSKIFKPLAVELIKHSFENTGFYTGVNSYFGYIHPSILQDMGLVDARNNAKKDLQATHYNKEQLDRISDQLIRNNAKKFTKVYDNNKDLFVVTDDGKTLTLDFDSSDSSKLKELVSDTQTTKYIRFALNDEWTPLYKLDEEASSSERNRIVYRQITYLGSPGKVVEINPFGEVITKFPNNRYENYTPKIKTTPVKGQTIKVAEEPEIDPSDDNSPNIMIGQKELTASKETEDTFLDKLLSGSLEIPGETSKLVKLNPQVQGYLDDAKSYLAAGQITQEQYKAIEELINNTPVNTNEDLGELEMKLCKILK